MDGRTARILLALVSVIFAVLLLLGIIDPLACAALFAIALVVLGIASRGFRGKAEADSQDRAAPPKH